MMEDIVGDYKDKTVTLEDFPWFDGNVKMATVHPCRHASVMKTLLDRADAALKIRREKLRAAAQKQQHDARVEGLVDPVRGLSVHDSSPKAEKHGDEWEVLQHDHHDDEEEEEEENEQFAIRVDQYLVVFLKFIASVTPGIEHDFTMGV